MGESVSTRIRKIPTTIYLDPMLYEVAKKLVDEGKFVSLSELIRTALREYLLRHGYLPPATAGKEGGEA